MVRVHDAGRGGPLGRLAGFRQEFTETTVEHVVQGPVESVLIEGVGHYVALEAPDRLAHAIAIFLAKQG